MKKVSTDTPLQQDSQLVNHDGKPTLSVTFCFGTFLQAFHPPLVRSMYVEVLQKVPTIDNFEFRFSKMYHN